MRAVRTRAKPKKSPRRAGQRPARAAADRANTRGWVLGRAGKSGNGVMARLARAMSNLPLVRRPMLLLTMLLIIAGAAAGLVSNGYIRHAKSTATIAPALSGMGARLGFVASDIQINGYDRTSAAAIRAALGIKPGDSILAFDPAAARARLRELPWVADAVVRRRLPNAIFVTVIEKRPFALWKQGNSIVVVERSGAAIIAGDPDNFAHLPLLMGEGAPESAAPLIDAIGLNRAVAARLKGIERVGDRRWDLILAGAVVVRLPETGWEAQLGELERLIVDQSILERDIEMIDLRYPDSYIFRLHNGDSHPVSRERPA